MTGLIDWTEAKMKEQIIELVAAYPLAIAEYEKMAKQALQVNDI